MNTRQRIAANALVGRGRAASTAITPSVVALLLAGAVKQGEGAKMLVVRSTLASFPTALQGIKGRQALNILSKLCRRSARCATTKAVDVRTVIDTVCPVDATHLWREDARFLAALKSLGGALPDAALETRGTARADTTSAVEHDAVAVGVPPDVEQATSTTSGVAILNGPPCDALPPDVDDLPRTTLIVGARGRGALFPGRYLFHRSVVDCAMYVVKLCLFCRATLGSARDRHGSIKRNRGGGGGTLSAADIVRLVGTARWRTRHRFLAARSAARWPARPAR